MSSGPLVPMWMILVAALLIAVAGVLLWFFLRRPRGPARGFDVTPANRHEREREQ
jgi:hypothetical protein